MSKIGYIERDNMQYPVFYGCFEKKWAWKRDGWIGDTSIISENIFEYAYAVDEKNTLLESLSGTKYFKQYITHTYARELESSWLIEGEKLDSIQLRSILVKKLGLSLPEWSVRRQHLRDDKENAAVEAALTLINSKDSLSSKQICSIHKMLEKGDSGSVDGEFGSLRTSPEYVLRFRNTYYEIIYEAPPANDVQELIDKYTDWWKQSKEANLPRTLGAALCHLYFVEIHPFHDGNGRMSRLLMDKYMCPSSEDSFRPYSIQASIRTHRTDSEITINEESVTTGISYPKYYNGKQIHPNTLREPLLPYFCISKQILGKPSTYYQSLDEYSSNYNINNFLKYIISLQENAIEGALRRVPLLYSLGENFDKYHKYLSDDEMLIIRNAVLSDGVTSDISELTADILDEEKGIFLCENLIKAGIISLYKTKVMLNDDTIEKLSEIKGRAENDK